MQKTMKRICFTVIALTVLSVLFALSASALVRGDIDEDKTVTPGDARIALRISVNLPKSTDPITDYSAKEKDIADMDMDLAITPADARAILRTAVQLDVTLPYYAYTVVTPPTCTTPGLYERLSTEATVGTADVRFTQEVPALGHDYSVLVDKKIPGTCTTPGYGTYKCVRCNLTVDKAIIVDHVWSPATCTTPKTCINCRTVNGSALGHTTMLGMCTRCGQYQGLMLDYYKTKIAPDLNEAVRALQKANTVLWDKYSEDYTKNTITIGDAKPYYITAYNHYYAAYEACGDFKEFKEAKELLYTICYKLLEIIYSEEVTKANYSTVVAEWMSTTNTILDQEKGYNAALKQITDTYKNPDTVSPSPSADPTPSVPDPGTNPGGTITPAG